MMKRYTLVLAGVLLAACGGKHARGPESPQAEEDAEPEQAAWLDAEAETPEPEPEPELLAAESPTFEGEPERRNVDPDGLEQLDYVLGEGPEAHAGATVRFHYIGTLLDGTQFDSTYKRNMAFEYEIGTDMVIPGLQRGLEGARAGMLRKLVIPPELAYGEREAGPIPAHATLVFYIDVLAIE